MCRRDCAEHYECERIIVMWNWMLEQMLAGNKALSNPRSRRKKSYKSPQLIEYGNVARLMVGVHGSDWRHRPWYPNQQIKK
jgi:hypothetical protein